MTFKERFNWLAQRPERNYTLGEAYQYFIQGKKMSVINDNVLGFTRAGRAFDRALTGMGAFIGVSIALTNLNSLTAVFAGVAVCGLVKAQSVISTKMIDNTIQSMADKNHPRYIVPAIMKDIREAKADRQKLKLPSP